MMLRYPRLAGLAILVLAFVAWPAGAARASERVPVRQSLDMQVIWNPAPVIVGGRCQLVYELRLTSFATQPLALASLHVMDEHGATVESFDADALQKMIGRPDGSGDATPLVLPPGATAVAYVTLPYPSGSAPRLVHRMDMESGGKHFSVAGAPVRPRTSPTPLELGPPLRGGPWVAVYNEAWPRGHRRVLYAINGRLHVPGRFAIDWIKVDAQGRYARGDEAAAGNWYGYGEDVIAVADAVVASASDDIAEEDSVTVHATRKVPLQDASGNYVSLDLGDGHYAFYEHLQPGSIRVKAGDRVRRGQVIAKLGYTGQSTGPHLHFHVADANDSLDAEGVPYMLTRYTLLGKFADASDLGTDRGWQHGGDTPQIRRAEMPAPMSVVQFPDE